MVTWRWEIRSGASRWAPAFVSQKGPRSESLYLIPEWEEWELRMGTARHGETIACDGRSSRRFREYVRRINEAAFRPFCIRVTILLTGWQA